MSESFDLLFNNFIIFLVVVLPTESFLLSDCNWNEELQSQFTAAFNAKIHV